MADVIYKKGQSANLNDTNVPIVNGQILVTEDKAEMFIDMSDGTRKKISDTDKVSKNELKTINGQELIGEGDITVSGVGAAADNNAEIFNDYENNLADGEYSSASGYSTEALAPYSRTEGYRTAVLNELEWSNQEITFLLYENNTLRLGAAKYIDNNGQEQDFFGKNNVVAFRLFTSKSKTSDIVKVQAQNYIEGGDFWEFTIDTPIADIDIENNTPVVNALIESPDLFAKAAHTEGRGTLAIDEYTHAEGLSTVAYGRAAHSEGWNTKTLGNYAHAEGATTEAGYAAHAEGSKSKAYGQYSHAEGALTISSGNYSHVEGISSEANGEFSHAGGSHCKVAATAKGGYAQGYGNETMGAASHAEGYETKAIGNYGAHAEGYQTQALGESSHASGKNTIAEGNYQTAIGKFNTPKDSNTLFIVGNGGSDHNRSNAFEVLVNGSATLKTMGTTDNSVATKKYVDDKVGNGSGAEISVDQTYNAESENAQSGKAVAQAIQANTTSFYNPTAGDMDSLKAVNSWAVKNAIEANIEQNFGGSSSIKAQSGSAVVEAIYENASRTYSPTDGFPQSGIAVAQAIEQAIGNVETVLDSIIAMQESLIGGATE